MSLDRPKCPKCGSEKVELTIVANRPDSFRCLVCEFVWSIPTPDTPAGSRTFRSCAPAAASVNRHE